MQLIEAHDQEIFIFGVKETKFLPRIGTQSTPCHDMDGILHSMKGNN
jgi:hypothetical protein